MITLLETGQYRLTETKNDTKELDLDGTRYVWVIAKGIGEILVTSHNVHKTDAILSVGKYRLYEVKDEPDLTDLVHLDLDVGAGEWQGYLLLTGLPNDNKKRSRIIPTHDNISGGSKFTVTAHKHASRGPIPHVATKKMKGG